MSEDILSTGQAAKLCSVTRDTMLKWIKSGKVRAVQTAGGHYRIKRESLSAYLFARPSVPAAASGEKPVSFCWEYHSDNGRIQHDCRGCMVFQSQARRCYLMAGLGDKAGNAGIHCRDNCYDCEYFHLISGDKLNVLVVTEDETLRERVRSEVSDKVTLRFSRCEYDTSAALQDFKPDFIIVDDSMTRCQSDEICAHMIADPRVTGAQIILAVGKGGGRKTLQEGVCASIHVPFSGGELEESFGRIRRNLWGRGHTDTTEPEKRQ